MTILVRAKVGESKEAALERVKDKYKGEKIIIEKGNETPFTRANGRGGGKVGELLNEYSKDKNSVMKSISEIRKNWGLKVKEARSMCDTSKNVVNEMKSFGGLTRYSSPSRVMGCCERYLGNAFSISKSKLWTIEKYYNIVSNQEMSEWYRGSTAGITYTDEVSFGVNIEKTNVMVEKSIFGEVRRLGFAAGEVVGQDMAGADKLAQAMKFPKLREGLTPSQRRSVAGVLKQANMGQNHLTRLVRGVLLVLGAEMSGDPIKFKADINNKKMNWCDYTPSIIEEIFDDKNSCAIWCNFPNRERYASLLPHLTQEWNCEGLPMRIKNIVIPSDGKKTYVVSLGGGELKDVLANADEIRTVLVTYAQSMACEDILDQAYCIGSMLLLHEHWPAVHLPASLWASDLIRPAMATKHEISRHKREWTLREAMVLSKYSCDVMGLMVKEAMSSGWDHNTETVDDAVGRMGSGSIVGRNEMYRWMVENITGEDTGMIYMLDPMNGADIKRIKAINDTSILKYWYVNNVKGVGNESLCGAMMCSTYTTLPSKGKDTVSARELGFLRQLEVVKNGPMYKKEIRLKKIIVEEEKKRLIEGTIKEGRVSVVCSGVSMVCIRERENPKLVPWECEVEKIDVQEYDDDSEDYEEESEDSESESDSSDDDEETSRWRNVEVEELMPSGDTEKDEDVTEKEIEPEVVDEDSQTPAQEVKKTVESVSSEGVTVRSVMGTARLEKLKEGGTAYLYSGPMVPELVVSGSIRREGRKDQEFLEALYDSYETARNSEYWQKLKPGWVKESKFMVNQWRKRRISEKVIEECCNLMKDIFPTTSLHMGKPSTARDNIVLYAGTLVGITSMGSDVVGEMDRNHFLIQMWCWKNVGKWLNIKMTQKVSDVTKELEYWRSELGIYDEDRWKIWARNKFKSVPSSLGKRGRAEVDQGIRMGRGKKLVEGICGHLGIRVPNWKLEGEIGWEIGMLNDIGLNWISEKRREESAKKSGKWKVRGEMSEKPRDEQGDIK